MRKQKANAAKLNGRLAVGIDVGKVRHSAVGLNAQGEVIASLRYFENSRDGINKLEKKVLKHMGTPAEILIAMEATGHYGMALHDELNRRDYDVVVFNPIQTSAASRALIRKIKSDPVDAKAIALLLMRETGQAARIPDPSTLELRLQTRQRKRLTFIQADLKRIVRALVECVFPELPGIVNLFSVSTRALIRNVGVVPTDLCKSPERVRSVMREASRNSIREKTIERLLKAARTSIGSVKAQEAYGRQIVDTFTAIQFLEAQRDAIDEQLAIRVEEMKSPLLSLPFSRPLIATIHAESDPIQDFKTSREYAAYCGLDPAVWQSGVTEKSVHISKRGSSHLRSALFLATTGHYRYIKALNERYMKVKPGRHHYDALTIVTHTLARIVWRLLTDNRPYSEEPPKPPGK